MKEEIEGWSNIDCSADKTLEIHYFRNGISLCTGIKLIKFHLLSVPNYRDEPNTGACKECWKKMRIEVLGISGTTWNRPRLKFNQHSHEMSTPFIVNFTFKHIEQLDFALNRNEVIRGIFERRVRELLNKFCDDAIEIIIEINNIVDNKVKHD